MLYDLNSKGGTNFYKKKIAATDDLLHFSTELGHF
jgi:hypothetical protein